MLEARDREELYELEQRESLLARHGAGCLAGHGVTANYRPDPGT